MRSPSPRTRCRGHARGSCCACEGERKSFDSGIAAKAAPPVVFMFSGQGSQYVNMGRDLYENEPVFRETLDLCAQQLMEPLALDLRQALYPSEEEKDVAAEKVESDMAHSARSLLDRVRPCALVDVAWRRA